MDAAHFEGNRSWQRIRIMNTFAELPEEERALYFQQYQAQRGVDAVIAEKDFWVCWLLDIVFHTEPLLENCVFKGGTSLSKVFAAIGRFSEDIDLSISPEFLGWDEAALDKTPSRAQRDKRMKALEAACADAVENQFQLAIESAITQRLGDRREGARWLSYERDDATHSPVLLFNYPGEKTSNRRNYIQPRVKLEFGSLTDQKPTGTHSVTAMVDELAPGHFDDCKATVVALSIERTFWEKATILHAEFHRKGNRERDRFSRHYSDLAALWNHPKARVAAGDQKLLARVVTHKSRFFASAWANYETARHGSFRLVPPPERIENLKRDYTAMAQMFFEPPPTFESILETLRQAEGAINAMPS